MGSGVLRGSSGSGAVSGRSGDWFRVFPGGSGRSGCGFWRYWHAGRWGGCARSSPLRCSVPEVPVLVPAEALVQVPRSVSVLVFKARDSYILKGGQWLIWSDSS